MPISIELKQDPPSKKALTLNDPQGVGLNAVKDLALTLNPGILDRQAQDMPDDGIG